MISTPASKDWLNQKNKGTGYVKYPLIKATLVRGVTLTAAHLGSFFEFCSACSHGKIQNRAQMRSSQSNASD